MKIIHQPGIHHITALAGDADQNAKFYVNTLGLRFALKSVNQDSPDIYHFFFTNGSGQPGSSMTFFPFPNAARGKTGTGEAVAISFMIPDDAGEYWAQRLAEHDISFTGPKDHAGRNMIAFDDPDGMRLELVLDPSAGKLPAFKHGPVPEKFGIRGFRDTTLRLASIEGTAEILQNVLGFKKGQQYDNVFEFISGSSIGHTLLVEKSEMPSAGRPGAGTVHHVAFRVRDENELDNKRKQVAEMGLQPTGIIDRFVFKSVYFRTPGGVLFEMATDGPGYKSAQDEKDLGKKLFLPPWLEKQREEIEKQLPPVSV